jgi:hypothetical protein
MQPEIVLTNSVACLSVHLSANTVTRQSERCMPMRSIAGDGIVGARACY